MHNVYVFLRGKHLDLKLNIFSLFCLININYSLKLYDYIYRENIRINITINYTILSILVYPKPISLI